jgi:hypothetical protein
MEFLQKRHTPLAPRASTKALRNLTRYPRPLARHEVRDLPERDVKAEANLVVRVHRGGLRRPVGGWSKIVAEIRVISEVTIRAEVRYGFGSVAAAGREMRFEGGGFGI